MIWVFRCWGGWSTLARIRFRMNRYCQCCCKCCFSTDFQSNNELRLKIMHTMANQGRGGRPGVLVFTWLVGHAHSFLKVSKTIARFNQINDATIAFCICMVRAALVSQDAVVPPLTVNLYGQISPLTQVHHIITHNTDLLTWEGRLTIFSGLSDRKVATVLSEQIPSSEGLKQCPLMHFLKSMGLTPLPCRGQETRQLNMHTLYTPHNTLQPVTLSPSQAGVPLNYNYMCFWLGTGQLWHTSCCPAWEGEWWAHCILWCYRNLTLTPSVFLYMMLIIAW